MANHRQRRIFLLVTLLTISILAGTILLCVRRASDEMTQHSFDELTASTRRLAADYYSALKNDQVLLSAVAELIAKQDVGNADTVLQIMNSFNLTESFLSSMILLLPDGRLLHRDGTWYNVSGKIDFEAEAAKGAYLSDRVVSLVSPDQLVVRSAAPVVKDGETAAILYGVITLQEIPRANASDYYNGKGFVLLVDGTSGDILLDTWHNTQGNLSELDGRETLSGYTYEQAVENMRQGRSGDMRSVSETTGDILYMHYEPVGINNWSLTIGVSKEDASAGLRSGVKALYLMALIAGTVLLAYMAYVIWYLSSTRRDIYRLSMTDQCTGLMNRRAYEAYLRENENHVFAAAACIYIDANGLHEINNACGHEAGDRMLRTTAECLKEQFPDGRIYRIGGDEFVVFPAEAEEALCKARMQNVSGKLAAHGHSISHGLAACRNAPGLRALVREADRRRGKAPAYGKEPQRSGRARLPALPPGRNFVRAGKPAAIGNRSLQKSEGAPDDCHARLHAPAAGAADHVRAAPSCLREHVHARHYAARRLPDPHERVPSGFGRAGRDDVSHRPLPDRRSARLCRPDEKLFGRRIRPGLRAGISIGCLHSHDALKPVQRGDHRLVQLGV